MTTSLDGAKIKRGDTYVFPVSITSGEFGVTDILEWQAKRKLSDTVPAISKSSATSGLTRLTSTTAQITLTPADTNGFDKQTTLYWEFQRKTADGLTVDTLILPSGETFGTLIIEPDYLRS